MSTTLVGQVGAVENIVTDPLSALLLVVGAGLLAFSLGFFGYLALRAFGAAIVPPPGRGPPRQAE